MSDRPPLLRTLRQGRYLRLAALCLLAAAVCVMAGVWQYHRWHGKHATNAELRASAATAPVPVGDLLRTDRPLPPADRFRMVTARGTWDAAGELYVRQRQVNSALAFLVVTPLRTDDGRTLLVVRGWQAATGSATQRPATPAPPPGEVALVGRAYPSEHGGIGANLPDRQIQRIDTAAIGSRLGVTVYDGYVELADQQPDPGNLAVLPAPDLTNPAGGADEWQHLAYVAQWFCLAALALAAPFLLAVLERRDATPRLATAADLDGTEPHAAEPDGAHPHAADPHAAEPDGAEPDGADPDGAGPHGAGPHGARPHGAGPHGAEPDGAGPHGAEHPEGRHGPEDPHGPQVAHVGAG